MPAVFLKEEIRVGSLVEIDLDQPGADPATAEFLRGWNSSYQWPLRVHARGSEHVTLKDNKGRIIHFGSTADPSFHVAHVKLVE